MKKLLAILLCFAVSGCASAPKTEDTYIVTHIGESDVQKLSDEEVVELYARIYNTPAGDDVDSIAKDITLTAFNNSLKMNRAGLYEDAQVLKEAYTAVDFKKWKDAELEKEYVALSKKLYDEKLAKLKDEHPDMIDMEGKSYWAYRPSVSDNAGKEELVSPVSVIRLTALFCLNNEIDKRDMKAAFWRGTKYAAVESAYVAAKIAMIIASYMI